MVSEVRPHAAQLIISRCSLFPDIDALANAQGHIVNPSFDILSSRRLTICPGWLGSGELRTVICFPKIFISGLLG